MSSNRKLIVGLFICSIVLLSFVPMSCAPSSTSIPSPPQPVNHPPYIPNNPLPANRATNVSTFTLSWTGGDPDPGDVVTYDVYFGTSWPPPLLFTHLSDTRVTQPFPMPPPATKCYWKVVAGDNHGLSTEGSMWEFTTTVTSPPSPVVIANTPSGPSTGKVNQFFTFTASASSNVVVNLEYRFDWGDGSYSAWSSSPSASHTWSNPGIYEIRAQAKYPGIMSEWSPVKVLKIEKEALSRQPFGQPEQMKQYITPNDPAVKAAVNEILSQQLKVFTDFETLRDWVSSHVSYESDQNVHGVTEYWQFPSETLRLRTGDCEDFAILLCSLLRAYGIPADQVYVAVGVSEDGTGHAYLIERWYQGVWRVTEPQYGALVGVLMADWLTTVSFETLFCFNDQHYLAGLPTLPPGVYEFKLSFIEGASATFERYMRSGEIIRASVEWLEMHGQLPDFSIFGWGLKIYDASGNTVFSWFGKDLQQRFSYAVETPGKYKVQVYIGGVLPASARLTMDPPDWREVLPGAESSEDIATTPQEVEKDLHLGIFVYEGIPVQLEEGDEFTGHVRVKGEYTVLLRLEDPKGKNRAPSQAVQYWEWHFTVAPGEGGKWMVYVENNKWLGVVDATLSYKVTPHQ